MTEISLRKLEIPREHFMQRWAQERTEIVWRFLKKLKVELPFDLAIPLLGICLEKKTLIQKDTCTPIFIAALFTIAKT